ncbi:MAG: replication factor C small subunit [Candidatus Thorarchaeota archaeon]
MEIDLWTEKHRPTTLGDIVGQESVIEKLKKFVELRTVPHCLFAGPPGTAKTTAGMAMAHDLFGESYNRNFMELNASDERGIDVVRNQIKNFARVMPTSDAPFKILVLDEADHLTTDAQHALRRTMESYASSCRMILICNYSSRIIPPIQSRCTIFKFNRLNEDAVSKRLKYIAKTEKVQLKPTGLEAILYIAEGDMRAAINLLQAASSTGTEVIDSSVFSISGRASPKRIQDMLQSAREKKFDGALDDLRTLIYHEGVSPVDLVRQIHREIAKLELSEGARMSILEKTAETEFRIAEGASGEVQLSSLLGYIGRELE